MHILYGEQPNITPPQMGLSGFPIATEVYANRALIAIDDEGGWEMVYNELTTGNNEQAPTTDEDEGGEFDKVKQRLLPTYMDGC